MFNHIKIKIIFTLLCLALVGCGGESDSPDSSASDPQALTQSALQKQEIGAYEEAVEILSKALSIDPQFTAAHYRMGLVYEEWDKKREAFNAYKKTVELDPKHWQARIGLGSVYSKMKNYDRAIDEYKKAAEMRPSDPEIQFKIALEYWYIQKLPETAEHYRKVIEINPKHIQAHLNLASVYERMKDWDNALKEVAISRHLGQEAKDTQTISIAESKLEFFKGRMNMTEEEFNRKTQPPFE